MRSPLFIVFVVSIPLSLLLNSCGAVEPSSSTSSTSAYSFASFAVFGDSSAAGALANTKIGELNDFGSVLGVGLEATTLTAYESLRKGNYSEDVFLKKIELRTADVQQSALLTTASWGVRSELERMSEGRKHQLYNLSKWGARFSAIGTQLSELNAIYDKSGSTKRADVLAVMFGGNDFCAAIPAEGFAHHVRDGLKLLAESHPQSLILVSSVPPMTQLNALHHDYEKRVLVRTRVGNRNITALDKTVKFASCKQFRKLFCAPLEKDEYKDLWREYNKVLDVEVQQFAANHSGKIKLVRGVSTLEIGKDDVAVDCFHPSEQGQKKIAKAFMDSLNSAD